LATLNVKGNLQYPPHTEAEESKNSGSVSSKKCSQMRVSVQNVRMYVFSWSSIPTQVSKSMSAETTEWKQRGRPFRKGRSGNPNGRPVGTRNRTTLAAEALLEGEAEKLTRKVITLALKGNVVCLRLCLDRIVPRRDRAVRFEMPTLNSAEDASKAMAAIATGITSGELVPAEAAELSRVVDGYVKTLEVTEIERRLHALEEKAARNAK
jgi:Family of unknown function (DUF5681)